MRFKILILIMFLGIFNNVSADQTTDLLNNAMKRADQIRINIPKGNPKGDQAAKDASDYLESEKFLKRVVEERKRLSKDLTAENPARKPSRAVLSDTEKIYIFISSSVPENTLRSYINDIDYLQEPNIIIVMRGFIGGLKKIQPTVSFINNLLKKDPTCDIGQGNCKSYSANIDIDPLAYRHFNINRVPAVAYADNVSIIDKEGSIGTPQNLKTKSKSDVYYGDMPLVYNLEKLSKKFPKLNLIVSKLKRKGFYNERN